MEFLQLGAIQRPLFTIRTETEFPDQVLPMPPDALPPAQFDRNAGKMQIASVGLVHGD